MNNSRRLIPFAVAAALAAYAGGAQASGFALIEQNASGLGNAYAGAAAVAEDASTIFFNPAGMTRLPGKQVVGVIHAIKPISEFTNSSSALPAPHALGGNGGDAGGLAVVPNAYFSWMINPNWSAGVGVGAPFGLKTEYEEGWIGRFQGLKSEIKTVNINPAVAFKASDAVSIGFGLNYQKIEATLTNAVNLGATAGRSQVEADDDSWGWNAGILFQAGPNTRIGLSYRSIVDYTLNGSVLVTTSTGATFISAPVHADITMPDTFSLSVAHQLNPRWELLGDVSFTRWSEIQQVRIVRDDTGATLNTLTLNFEDTYRVSVGANYKMSDAFTLKLGVAYDKSPVEDAFRSVRLPDNDRYWLAVGGKYRMSKQATLDFGYTHIFINDAPINNMQGTAGGQNGNVVGNYKASVDILSAQLSFAF
jgi:long-chain fatty acid transport protein